MNFFPKGLELSTNSFAIASTTMLMAALVTLREGCGSLCGDWVRQLFVRFVINTVTHAFVCAAHTESISVGLFCQAFVKQRIAMTATVEDFLADIFFLRFALFFWWQIDGGRIATQHGEILVAQIFVLILKKDIKISI